MIERAKKIKATTKKIYGGRKIAALVVFLSLFWFSGLVFGNRYIKSLSPLSFWFANISMAVGFLFSFTFAFVIPFYTYNELGIKKVGLKKYWLWKNVTVVYTDNVFRNTFIFFKPYGMALLSPDTTHNYYEILNDILIFVSRKKVDEFTLKIAKAPSKHFWASWKSDRKRG